MAEEKIIGTFKYGALFTGGMSPLVRICQLVFTDSKVFFYDKRPPELSGLKLSLIEQFVGAFMGKAGSREWKYLKSVMNPSVDYSQRAASEDLLKYSDWGFPYKSIKRVRITNASSPIDQRDPSDADDVIILFERGLDVLSIPLKFHITTGSVGMVKELIQKTPLAPILVIEL